VEFGKPHKNPFRVLRVVRGRGDCLFVHYLRRNETAGEIAGGFLVVIKLVKSHII